MKATIKMLGHWRVVSPSAGSRTLNMWPAGLDLPEGFERFQMDINKLFSLIPHDPNSSNEHFITIDSKYFATDSALRREGLHIDGNFCVDPAFQLATTKKAESWVDSMLRQSMWASAQPITLSGASTSGGRQTWGGTTLKAVNPFIPSPRRSASISPPTPPKKQKSPSGYEVVTPFKSEFGTKIPEGVYVSEDFGGIISVSDLAGCEAYDGELGEIEVESEGNVEDSRKQIEDSGRKWLFLENQIYFMTSNTPHESLIIPKGNRRTLIRVTLAHDYPNKLIQEDNGK